jgi:hypothetical protein
VMPFDKLRANGSKRTVRIPAPRRRLATFLTPDQAAPDAGAIITVRQA